MTTREKKMEAAKKEETANGEPSAELRSMPAPALPALYPLSALSFREAKTMPEAPHEFII